MNLRAKLVWVVLPVAAWLVPGAAAAQTAVPAVFPANGAVGVNPDTHLVLRFASAPTVGTSGTIRIYDAADHGLVDTLDLSLPAGPDPAHRVPVVASKAIDGAAATPTTTTPAVRTIPADLHRYQLDTIGGLADFHFYPVLVHGSVATIYPHHNRLQYQHTYEVEMDAGVLTVAGGGFAGFDAKHGWRFTTKAAGPARDATRVVVAGDGSGDFNTVQGAVDFVPGEPAQRVTIFIKSGRYEEIVFFQKKSKITFLGEDRDGVQIGYGNNSAFNPPMPGPSRRCAFSVYDSTEIELANLTLNNFFTGQAEALLVFGSKNIVNHVTLRGSGDALNLRGPVYLTDSTIVGDGDTILGVGPAFFNHCEIRSLGPFMWIRNPEGNHGNVFLNSTFTAVDRPLPWTAKTANPVKASAVLARLPNNHGLNYPWAEAVLLHCRLEGIPAEGWGPIEDETSHINFVEYDSTGGDGRPVDTSKRHPVSKQWVMPRDQGLIEAYSDPAFVLHGWTPAPSFR